jgi:asparagine synthase (glutamine-hydrolysing)
MAHSFLGQNISLAPKRPVQTPQREWLAGQLREWVECQLEVLCANTNWFEKKRVMETWKNYLQGQQDNSFYLWQWINTASLLK